MKEDRKMVCPNGCNANFITSAHVMQEWEVNAFGEFQEVVSDCLQVTHPPDQCNLWICSICGAEGVLVKDLQINKRTSKHGI